MDFAANLDVLQAAFVTPPAYVSHADDIPSDPAAPLVFEIAEPLAGGRNAAHRERLRHAPMVSRATPPDSRTGTFTQGVHHLGRRLVSAGTQTDGAFTEALANTRQYPMSAVGKLTASFGGNFRNCTGTVVAERVVLTAAHCVFARGTSESGKDRFAEWVTFEPGYNNGEVAGRWAGEVTYIHAGWGRPTPGTNVGPYDYAFIRLDSPIAHVTGTASLVTDASPDGPFTALGYPRLPRDGFRFDGRFLYASTGNRIVDKGVGTIQAENGLTEGSSGGPWFTPTGHGLGVVGINSTKPVKGDDSTWSPVFSDGFQRLLARVLADMTGA